MAGLDEDLLLDVQLPGGGLLDDLQLDCGLDASQLPPGLDDGLGLGVSGGAAGAHPAASDLLESLQLDAFALAGSGGSHGSPSGSGTDSPVELLLPGDLAALAAAPGPSQRPRRTAGASPATSESENNGAGVARGRSGSPASAATAQRAAGSGDVAPPVGAGQQYSTEDEKRMVRNRVQFVHIIGKCCSWQAPTFACICGSIWRLCLQMYTTPACLQRVLSLEAFPTSPVGPALPAPQARMQRNRENAQLSRQRKKQQMEDLQVGLPCSCERAATIVCCSVHLWNDLTFALSAACCPLPGSWQQ
jgi:hypothetical protein